MEWRFKKFLFIVTILPVTVFSQSHYWQQEVNYSIHVALNDSSDFLTGDISIEYVNHSPDTLKFIWFHLWPNAYKNTRTAFAKQQIENRSTAFYYSTESDKGFIDQLHFSIDGRSALFNEDEKNIDIGKLLLNEPLLPGKRINITTPFRVKIPKTFSRLGHVGQSYQITQWYPKPAVYDRIGWHPIPYLDQGEFYSEFGSFDVSISLPENYIVGATGSLRDIREKQWLDSLAEASAKKFSGKNESNDSEATNGDKNDERPNAFPSSSQKMKTLHYSAQNVHDFAWFADKRYHVMKSHVSLPGKDTVITTWTMFTDENASMWKDAIHYVDSSVIYYSKWVGSYPYPQATAVEGVLRAGDGMEYPMITVISGNFHGVKSLETVIAHEVGHNWFYGMLGFNEREHPWMDEGINSFYENRYVEKRYPHEGFVPGNSFMIKVLNLDVYPRSYQNYLLYAFQAYHHVDQPMDMNANRFTFFNYAAIAYAKTAIVFRYLEANLGTAVYDQIMHEFFEEWKFKHPYPEDLKNFFEEKTKKELDWIFNQIIPTKEYLDYKLVQTDDTTIIGNSHYEKLTVVNKGDVKGPYPIEAIKNGRVINEVWYGGFNGKMEVLFPKGDYDEYRIDASMDLPEVNRQNNTIRTTGILRHTEKIRLQWLGSATNPERTQLFFTPVAAWNYYDKFWAGLAFYNSVLADKSLSFLLIPSYGFGSRDFIGLGKINLQLFPQDIFVHRIDISSTAKSFNYAHASFFGEETSGDFRFMKLTQQVKITFKKNNPRNWINEDITLRNIFISLQEPGAPNINSSERIYSHFIINQLTYSLQDQRILNPYGISVSIEGGWGFYLKAYLEGNYRINYPRKKSGVDIRLFTGCMILNPDGSLYPKFHLGPTTGSRDYLFDELYLGRTEMTGFLSHQIEIENDGGFKMLTDGVQPEPGGSDTWIFAMNGKVPLPLFTRLFVFADIGITPSSITYSGFQFDAGAGFKLIPDMIEVYFPLVFSKDIKLHVLSANLYDSWYKRISFTLNLNKINPFEMIRNFDRL